MMLRKVLIFLFATAYSNLNGIDSLHTIQKKLKVIGFPVVYYTPETRWALGATSITTINSKFDSTNIRPSSVQFGFAITQLKQFLFYMPYQLWIKNNSINIQGELGYYIYNYYFYGIGNNFEKENQELYDITFPRFKLALLKQCGANKFLGIKTGFDDFKISNLEVNGSLAQDTIRGSRGGKIFPIGVIFKIDSRDNIFNASKGVYLEAYIEKSTKNFVSNFSYTKFSVDLVRYIKITKKANLVVNGFLQSSHGDVPFFQLPGIGGNKKLRGYYEFYYRDYNSWVLQTEWRQHIYGVLGCTFFAGMGEVHSDWKNTFTNTKNTYGAGLRVLLDKKQKINLRLDLGVAERKANYYFTILEAF